MWCGDGSVVMVVVVVVEALAMVKILDEGEEPQSRGITRTAGYGWTAVTGWTPSSTWEPTPCTSRTWVVMTASGWRATPNTRLVKVMEGGGGDCDGRRRRGGSLGGG